MANKLLMKNLLKSEYSAKVWKNGRGLVINIPKTIYECLGVADGDTLTVSFTKGGKGFMAVKNEECSQ